jgi:hypothetical protein
MAPNPNQTKRLANPAVLINNNAVPIIPNTFRYTEGLGDQKVEATSAGGNAIAAVYALDVATRISSCHFEIANTEYNIELARQWKLNGNLNVITVTGDTFSRTFTSASLVNDYEVSLGSDANIPIDWRSNPVV